MKTLLHTTELFADVMNCMVEYHQIGETVCGAEDPAVIEVNDVLGKFYPELVGLNVVRVVDQFVNSWHSETLLTFSSHGITAKEYALFEKYMDELDS